MLELVRWRKRIATKKKEVFTGKFVSCNGINMAKTCVCICDEDHSYDPFIAGMLVGLCAKNDKSIAGYLHE